MTHPQVQQNLVFQSGLQLRLALDSSSRNLHSIPARSESFAVSSASMAISRVTVRNCSRNSSTAAPDN